MVPGGQVHTQRCSMSVTTESLKNQLASELRIPAAVLILTKDGMNESGSNLFCSIHVY